ncbi:MAG TPA: glycosyltransferase [Albitalea sp.]|nr:glycosyltransferase [Albitalea sp.]
MIFVTVGSMFPFDRLIRSVDELVGQGVITEPVIAQIGDGRYEPRHMPFERFLAKPQYDQRMAEARVLLAHAGAGTIALALAHHKPLLVLPRLKRHREHVNDHQLATARKFEQLGHVLVAYDERDIAAKLHELAGFVPRARQADPQRMARRIGAFLSALQASR